jgi:hypothetical protein
LDFYNNGESRFDHDSLHKKEHVMSLNYKILGLCHGKI